MACLQGQCDQFLLSSVRRLAAQFNISLYAQLNWIQVMPSFLTHFVQGARGFKFLL